MGVIKPNNIKPFVLQNDSNYENLKKIIEALPNAFNSNYWSMGDTNYKEEILITARNEGVITDIEAHQLTDEIFEGRRLLHQIINGEVKEVMGCYIKE